uniref:Uncharacterized protein MANES_06G173000 n=1 Tax=Rhizophora mucronata TaxID=61149 RepID=A0A2P2KNM0_RHIMU
MFFISTFIDLNQGVMIVESPRCSVKLQINLKTDSCLHGREEITMHGQRYEVEDYETDVNLWFSNAVGFACTLLRHSSAKDFHFNKDRSMLKCRDAESRLNFANEAQFLLISEESVSDLNSRIKSNVQKGTCGTPVLVNAKRFRPNLVVSGAEPYAEDGWRSVTIGNKLLTSLGGCSRCQMINFVHQGGQVHKSKEPLTTLASYRRVKGKILFGILLRYELGDNHELDADPWIRLGQEVYTN